MNLSSATTNVAGNVDNSAGGTITNNAGSLTLDGAAAQTYNNTGAGTDYTDTSAGVISIPAGSTSGSATITLPLTNDVLLEGAETVIVNMGVPTNALAGTTTTHTLTINDD